MRPALWAAGNEGGLTPCRAWRAGSQGAHEGIVWPGPSVRSGLSSQPVPGTEPAAGRKQLLTCPCGQCLTWGPGTAGGCGRAHRCGPWTRVPMLKQPLREIRLGGPSPTRTLGHCADALEGAQFPLSEPARREALGSGCWRGSGFLSGSEACGTGGEAVRALRVGSAGCWAIPAEGPCEGRCWRGCGRGDPGVG